MLKIAMIVPPSSNLNTPYSAAPRLVGWLRKLGHAVDIVDLNLELFLRMYSRKGLERLFPAVDPLAVTGEWLDVYHNQDRYLRVIDGVVRVLQNQDPALAHRIVRGDLVPEGPNFRVDSAESRKRKFGSLGKGDLARHLCTMMLCDLADFFHRALTPHYGLVEYADELSEHEKSFDAIEAELTRPPNIVETMMLEVAAEHIPADVDLVCFTVAFPGMLLGSLIIGRWLAEHRPRAHRALGGGFPSTELRSLEEPRIFDYVDTISLDDGEVPLQQICARLTGAEPNAPLHKTFTREAGKVVYHEQPDCASPRFRDLPPPDYRGCDLNRYINLVYPAKNPVHRLLTEGAWLKLTAAHGCYWKKCTFCDIHLSYIGDFDPLGARELADQMDALHDQTGLSSFHFTDEAAPPPLLVNLSLELLRRGRAYQFWGNVRFDTGFTPDRCRLLAAAGMTAVTGGIEVASDELLPVIAKGITVPSVVKVLEAFSGAGIFTHAYLIYGFPGETRQDTVNSLDIVRQLIKAGLLHSAFYHLFGMTAHSPIGRNPEVFGIRAQPSKFAGFTHNILDYEMIKGQKPSRPMLDILQKALRAYTDGFDLDRDVRTLFPGGQVPPATVPPDFVETCMQAPHPALNVTPRLCWLGGVPRWSRGLLNVICADGDVYTALTPRELADNLQRCHPATWVRDAPPRPDEFEAPEWFVPMRPRGMVVV